MNYYYNYYNHLTVLWILCGTTRVSRYQKSKTNLDFIEARDSEWQWHQLGHMQSCTSPQTDNHTSTPPLKFFTGRMPFLLPNQQHQYEHCVSKITNFKIISHKTSTTISAK